MLEYREIPDTNIIELTIDGDITKDDFDGVLAQMTSAVERHGKVRLLEEIRVIGSYPVSRVWADLKFGFQHMRDITHVAVVADQKWIEVLTKIVNPMIRTETKFFPSDKLDEARDWLKTTA